MYVPLPVRVQEIPLQMWSLDIFGLVYSKHFKSNSQRMACLPRTLLDDPGLQGQPRGDLVPFVGPTWCDDLSICLWADTAKAVETGASIATGLILDLCRQHGMTPNLRKGKTAVLLSLQGKDSRQIKRTYFDGRDAGRLTVIGEHVTYQVQVCGEYKHLGGLIHAKGDMRREVGKRLAMAHTAFGLHRKLVFQNPIFPLRKRTQLFTTLVLTKLTFGMESWDLSDTKTKNKLHVGIMRLYRRLLGGAHDRHLTDQDILTTLELPSPTTLLRQTRLRYLGSLYTSAPSEIWSVLHGDAWWRCLIQDDIQWMWKQLCRSSPLTDPMTDFTYWEFLMRQYPGYWKRLVRRAVYHDVLQAKNRYIVDRAHHGIINILHEFGKLPTAIASPTDKQVDARLDRLDVYLVSSPVGLVQERLCTCSGSMATTPNCATCTTVHTARHAYVNTTCQNGYISTYEPLHAVDESYKNVGVFNNRRLGLGRVSTKPLRRNTIASHPIWWAMDLNLCSHLGNNWIRRMSSQPTLMPVSLLTLIVALGSLWHWRTSVFWRSSRLQFGPNPDPGLPWTPL